MGRGRSSEVSVRCWHLAFRVGEVSHLRLPLVETWEDAQQDPNTFSYNSSYVFMLDYTHILKYP